MRVFERLRGRAFRPAPTTPPRDLAPFALAVLALVFALWLGGFGYMILSWTR